MTEMGTFFPKSLAVRIMDDLDAISRRIGIFISSEEGRMEVDGYRFMAITRQITEALRLKIELHLAEHESD